MLLCLPLIREETGWIGWPLLSTLALSIVLSAIPGGRARSFRADWIPRGAVNRLVGQRLLRSHAAASREIADLTVAEPKPVQAPMSSLLRRLVDSLRSGLDRSAARAEN